MNYSLTITHHFLEYGRDWCAESCNTVVVETVGELGELRSIAADYSLDKSDTQFRTDSGRWAQGLEWHTVELEPIS